MSSTGTQLSNPYSTGNGGAFFESRVQAAYLALMLSKGFAPGLPCWPIVKIKLQGKYAGFQTDDLIVFTQSIDGLSTRKMLGQIKHTISITKGDVLFGKVIQSAWTDFNKPQIFSKTKDIFALITGPLSATDTQDVRTILEWARTSPDADDFFYKVAKANFSSEDKREKLAAFEEQLKKANGGVDVPQAEIYSFLCHFHLFGYDLDIQSGVILALLHTVIGPYSQGGAHGLWTQLVDEIQSNDPTAGTITPDSVSEELRLAFSAPLVKQIPKAFAPLVQKETTIYVSAPISQQAQLVYASFLGYWNEQNAGDTEIAGQLAHQPFLDWISSLRETLVQPNSPIQLKDGYWKVKDRLALWQDLGPRISDANLDRFRDCAIKVLSEKSPKFELPSEQHYMANVIGKVDLYSPSIRQGIAVTLALLGNYSDACSNASKNKRESTALVVVRTVLESKNWILWGSLNDLLPLFAEAAPDAFLDAVEATLRHESNPYAQLFALGKGGITGTNYLTGMFWALETLAWEERYLARVTLILGHLAAIDPGGNSGNNPANSLVTIFLPWYPRTLAPLEKRKAAILSLKSDFPDQAWNLLLGLQSQFNQMSFGTRKPEWRKSVAKDWEPEISAQEYEAQVLAYAEILVSMASEDDHRLISIAEHLDRLPKRFFDSFMKHLIQRTELKIPPEERNALWSALSEFAAKHRRYPDAKWALPAEALEKIEEAAKSLEPQDPVILYQRIFAKREMDLVPAGTSWEDANKRLEVQRRQALLELGSTAGVLGILQFALSVESPEKVGYTYGCISDSANDAALLPEYLLSEDQATKAFAASYIWGRFQKQGYAWVDQLDKSAWTIPQKVRFFTCLPSNGETWDRVTTLLANDEGEYWRAVHVNPYAQDCDLNRAIAKLLEYGRPKAAVSCFKRLDDLHMPINVAVLAQTLLATVGSTESANEMDMYEVMELIKVLHKSPEALPNDIAKVEWAYLQLMRNGWGVSPQFLEQKLASDPVFFCEMIRRAYPSIHEEESKAVSSEQEQSMAINAYRLLQEWRTFPGTMPDGSLSQADLDSWLAQVIANTQESGHLDVALRIIGRAAFHGPEDPTGLWIHKAIASNLNANTDHAETLRQSFYFAVYNSRGAHIVDPSGQDDLRLASNYDQQADDLEAAGYPRFGATIRKIADHYRNEAQQNQSHSSDEPQP